MRKSKVDGTPNPDYGKVVNFVQVPPPFGVEGEPHHMQYEWQPGQPIVAGHLFTDLTTIWDVSDIPNITLKNIVRGEENPIGAFPDAYDFVGDKAIGTYMTAGEPNYGGSPGSIVVFKPDSSKGMVQESETAASRVGAVFSGNEGGIPEPCTPIEGRPMGTCGNPHGIQARPDLDRMVTDDYADARELGSDPLKTVEQHAFRPTVRVWDISNPASPKLISVAHMPKSVKNTPNPAHDNIGIMEGAKTYAPAKGMFSGSMCGGGIFYLPDMTNVQPDSSSQWKQVWDDGMAAMQVQTRDVRGAGGGSDSEPGACAGGAWHQVTPDNRFLFRAVGGRNPGSINTYDNGNPKMIYVINIEKLVSGRDRQRQRATSPAAGSSARATATLPTARRWPACSRSTTTPAAARTGAPSTTSTSPPAVRRPGACSATTSSPGPATTATTAATCSTSTRRPVPSATTPPSATSGTARSASTSTAATGPATPAAGFYKPHSMVFVTPPSVGGS